jgi:hypothetical protein
MGTSADFSGGRGGPWTGYKRAATSFAKNGGRQRAGIVLARHVATLGGTAGAVSSASAGRLATQRLGGVLAGIAEDGLPQTLERLGLQSLVGKDRFDVLEGLIDAIAGDGDDLEAQAARSAALDVLDQLLPDEDADTDLSPGSLSADDVRTALAAFIAAYIYNRAAPVIEERLNRLADAAQALARDEEIRDYVRSIVDLRLADIDPLTVDWQGDGGTPIVQRILDGVYDIIEAYDE